MIRHMVVCTMVKQMMICIMIKHTVIWYVNLHMGTFGAEIKVEIKINPICAHTLYHKYTIGLRSPPGRFIHFNYMHKSKGLIKSALTPQSRRTELVYSIIVVVIQNKVISIFSNWKYLNVQKRNVDVLWYFII